MMKLSANISTMFIEYASLDRLAAGFCAMEMQFPYELDLGALEAAPRQPGTGQINWPAFFATVQKLPYASWTSSEKYHVERQAAHSGR
jgi:hydroxypyruvate isomerase